MENNNTKIKAELKALFNDNSIRFINVDLGVMSGVIYILGDNSSYPTIMSKIVEIDELLGVTLDGDILDTHIHITFEGETQDLRVKITFDYET